MIRAQLHLVDTAGNVVCPEVESAVERAFSLGTEGLPSSRSGDDCELG